MLTVVPYELDDIKNELKRKAIEELGFSDAEFEGSNISQLINILAYSTLINNTNFTFGLNEMFISQAKDRKNIIKHARQLGYANKRKISYQYKIKLTSIVSGALTISKYMNFSSAGNNYIYMGESFTSNYGTYAYIKNLFNEYNNGLSSLYSSDALLPGSIIITEEGEPCTILERELTGSPKLMVQSMNNIEIPTLSTLPKKVFYWLGDYDSATGYRNLTEVGSIDTFILEGDIFKVQLSLLPSIDFPAFTKVEYSTTISASSMFALATNYPIKHIEKIIAYVQGEELEVDLNSLIYESGDYNVTFPQETLAINESHTGDIENNPDYSASLTSNKVAIAGSLSSCTIEFLDGRTRDIDPSYIVVEGSEFTIPSQTTPKTDIGANFTPGSGEIALLKDDIKEIVFVSITSGDITTIWENYEILGTNQVRLLNSDLSEYTGLLAGDSVNIEYTYYEDLSESTITIGYSYLEDSLIGSVIDISYVYDMNQDGKLDLPFFFSDLRGETSAHETNYDENFNPNGWNGFSAYDWDEETQVLFFDVSAGNNLYVNTDYEGKSITPKNLAEVLVTPFRNTRFSVTEPITDALNNIVGYLPFDSDSCFASLQDTDIKNSVEIIVKEGTMKRYADTDEDNNLLYPELIYNVTNEMIEAQYFVVYGKDIENDGIELFITRALDDGTIEFNVPWLKRKSLLAEKTDSSYSFIDLSNTDYEEYINIYTRYAGTGEMLKADFICRLNLLYSSGALGKTTELIEPIDSTEWEAAYYITENLTPHVIFVEGSDEESSESIRTNAPLFSNTANRAVTKNDYKTITEAQAYISQAEVWGGEEETPQTKPGNVFISAIPYSRPVQFLNNTYVYTLDKIDYPELFYPTFLQITGKEGYNKEVSNSVDQNILFNVLNNYKIITLQLNYIKSIYLDYEVQIQIIKYKFGQSIAETHLEMFTKIKEFFVRKQEFYNSIFYRSSLIKELDTVLGDDYGLKIDIGTSVSLFDSKTDPDTGTFRNYTLSDLGEDINGFTGLDDTFVFEMPINYPMEALFEDNVMNNGILVSLGRMYVEHITNCNTDSFLAPGDSLVMLLDDGTFVSQDENNLTEQTYASSNSTIIEISVMYKPAGTALEYGYRVGTFTIYRHQQVMMLRLFTKFYDSYTDIETAIAAEGTEIQIGFIGGTPLTVKETYLPRNEFFNTSKKMKINPYSNNIKNLRNVFSRLTKVEFTS